MSTRDIFDSFKSKWLKLEKQQHLPHSPLTPAASFNPIQTEGIHLYIFSVTKERIDYQYGDHIFKPRQLKGSLCTIVTLLLKDPCPLAFRPYVQ